MNEFYGQINDSNVSKAILQPPGELTLFAVVDLAKRSNLSND